MIVTLLLWIVGAIVVQVAVVALWLKWKLNRQSTHMDMPAAIDAEAAKLVRSFKVQSLAVGVYKNGELFNRFYPGSQCEEVDTTPSDKYIYQIASVSKLFTASLLKILCTEGVVELDATLGKLLGHRYPLSPAARQITLRQLVTHTSGLPRIPRVLEKAAKEKAGKEDIMHNPYSWLGPEYIFDYLKSAQGMRRPGKFAYSNLGMGLLGHVLELVTETPFEELVQRKLLIPLGMHDTVITLASEQLGRSTQGYRPNGQAVSPWRFKSLAGAGAFCSSTGDMLRFIQAIIEDDSPLSATLKSMFEPQPSRHSTIGWLKPSFTDRLLGNTEHYWHNGMVVGHASYVSVDLETRTGVILLSNNAIDLTMSGMMISRVARLYPDFDNSVS